MACNPSGTGTLPTPPSPPPDQPAPTAGQTCPDWVHAAYTVKGPDGRNYATWHPQVDATYRCVFNHEHGDDPRFSLADPTLPAFGYVGAVHVPPMEEAHAGFKVFVANKGMVNDEGRVALNSSRIVAHMGTGGVRRFTERMHSLEFDLIAPSGHEVHVQGMADTGVSGSICARDFSLQDNNPANDVGRSVMIVKGKGCDVGSLYEIWTFKMRLAEKVEVVVSTAAFDPITTMDPDDTTKLIYTRDHYGLSADLHGCDREAYHGPVYWYNKSGSFTFRTDAMGNLSNSLNPAVSLEQRVSLHDDIGIPMARRSDGDLGQFKYHKSSCAPGLGLKN